MGEAIVSIVAGRLNDLLKEEPQLLGVGLVGDEIQQVVTKLMWINTFLRDAYSRIYEPRIHILLAEVRDIAYDAEHVVESFIVKAASSSTGKTTPNTIKFIKNLKDIQTKMSILSNRFNEYNIRSTRESSNSSHETQAKLKRFYSNTTVEPEIFVGFQKDVKLLVGHLVNESDDSYPLISICGMGGLGKTTLAQKIYNHPTIKSHFDGLAWVSISQKWQTKNVLQRILRCLAGNGSKTKESESRSETEWVEQDEPGVYITLTSLPGGVKDLKRVRFSRKRFSEKQAEQWWAENRGRVYEKYNVRMVDKSSVGIGSKTKESDSRSETEWVQQDEPGVYITLTSIPGGVKDLKRVRFSRKRFSEKQAEQWWAENRGRVYEKYNVRMVDKSSVGIGSEDFTL